jgi:plasmid rolling circle replication initiator protein Rep
LCQNIKKKNFLILIWAFRKNMFQADLKTSIFFHRRFSREPLLKKKRKNRNIPRNIEFQGLKLGLIERF